MDKFLAELYQTNEVATQEDQLVEKIAADLNTEGVDLDQMTEAEISDLADAYLAEEGGAAAEAAEATTTEEGGAEKTAAQEQFENADYMGRIMAHSLVNELNSIDAGEGETEKTAAGRARAAYEAMKGAPGKAVGYAKAHPGKAGAIAGGVGGAALLARHLAKKRGKTKSGSGLDAIVDQKVLEVLDALDAAEQQ